MAGEGVAGLTVDEKTDLFDLGEIGVEGAEDGVEGKGFGFDPGGVAVDEVAAEIDDGEFAAGRFGLKRDGGISGGDRDGFERGRPGWTGWNYRRRGRRWEAGEGRSR